MQTKIHPHNHFETGSVNLEKNDGSIALDALFRGNEHHMPLHQEIWLSRQTIVRVLSTTAFLLVIASLAGQFSKYALGHDRIYGLVHLFYVDSEGNIPTFFSSFLLLFASLLLALISALKERSHDGRWPQWAILALTVLFMAVDEAAGIHELLHEPAEWVLHQRAAGIFYFAWVIFGLAFVSMFALAYLKFFFSLPPQTQKQFFVAVVTFLSGALGIEIVGGYYAGSHGEHNFQYSLIATVEEALEMAGVIILINALLHYLIHHYEVRLCLNHSGKIRSS